MVVAVGAGAVGVVVGVVVGVGVGVGVGVVGVGAGVVGVGVGVVVGAVGGVGGVTTAIVRFRGYDEEDQKSCVNHRLSILMKLMSLKLSV